MTIDDVIKSATEKSRIKLIGNPVSAEGLALCQKSMMEKGFPSIPQEYTEFLEKINGCYFLFDLDDIQFYGTKKIRNLEHSSVKDLIFANKEFAKLYYDMPYGWTHYVIIGECHGSHYYYLYNTKSGCYQAHCYDAGTWYEYKTFEEMFVGVVAPRI